MICFNIIPLIVKLLLLPITQNIFILVFSVNFCETFKVDLNKLRRLRIVTAFPDYSTNFYIPLKLGHITVTIERKFEVICLAHTQIFIDLSSTTERKFAVICLADPQIFIDLSSTNGLNKTLLLQLN